MESALGSWKQWMVRILWHMHRRVHDMKRLTMQVLLSGLPTLRNRGRQMARGVARRVPQPQEDAKPRSPRAEEDADVDEVRQICWDSALNSVEGL